MNIYNYSDDPRHDLEIYEQEQEKMDKRAERLEQLTKEAEEMYRTEELCSLLCWYKDNWYMDGRMEAVARALKSKDYARAGRELNSLIRIHAPELAREYAEKMLAYEED